MYVRKVKRKCGVRGCKSFEAFAISKTREPGNSIIICRECLKDANKSVAEMKPNEKNNIRKRSTGEVPGLFFNKQVFAEIEKDEVYEKEEQNSSNKEDDLEAESDKTEISEEQTEEKEDVFKCPGCGTVFESEKGLKSHLRYCAKA
jgi:hypothetical protein